MLRLLLDLLTRLAVSNDASRANRRFWNGSIPILDIELRLVSLGFVVSNL
jgi:hypothetical protein